MNCTIDASVFVAAVRIEEEYYAASRQFLQQVQALAVMIFCPTLVLAECAAAIARPTGDESLAGELVTLIQDFPAMRLIAVELFIAHQAARIATRYRLRGADAIYAATAESCQAALVTWDEEMLERCRPIIPTYTPTLWLQRQGKG